MHVPAPDGLAERKREIPMGDRSGDARANAEIRIVAPRRLTPTERSILTFISEREGKPCTKRELALALGRNQKTIDRLVSNLRADGLLVSVSRWGEDGGQLANSYKLGGQ